MGEDVSQCKIEVVVLCVGIEFGLIFIDIVEMYVDGGVEKVVGEVLIGLREKVFFVFKVYLWNVGG